MMAKSKDGRPKRPVVRVDIKTGEVVRFGSLTEAAKIIGVGIGQINLAIVKGGICHGFRFYHAEDYEGR